MHDFTKKEKKVMEGVVLSRSFLFSIILMLACGSSLAQDFSPAVRIDESLVGGFVNHGDLNGDGLEDLVVVGGMSIKIMLNNIVTPGAFALASEITFPSDVSRVALGDINQDHRIDIVVGHGSGYILRLLTSDASNPGAFIESTVTTQRSGCNDLKL